MDLMRFTEIEHKFVVDDTASIWLASDARSMALGPSGRTSVQVRDRYFLTRDGLRRRVHHPPSISMSNCTS
ncbi:MAG: hypothetical protein MZW92_52845 [Comamonadaceae bacterium]|nr:hypothetical protein [Comamonadaceae bacterium]